VPKPGCVSQGASAQLPIALESRIFSVARVPKPGCVSQGASVQLPIALETRIFSVARVRKPGCLSPAANSPGVQDFFRRQGA